MTTPIRVERGQKPAILVSGRRVETARFDPSGSLLFDARDRVVLERDRGFESLSLQRRVACEPEDDIAHSGYRVLAPNRAARTVAGARRRGGKCPGTPPNQAKHS
jgi:hypothetical protein